MPPSGEDRQFVPNAYILFPLFHCKWRSGPGVAQASRLRFPEKTKKRVHKKKTPNDFNTATATSRRFSTCSSRGNKAQTEFNFNFPVETANDAKHANDSVPANPQAVASCNNPRCLKMAITFSESSTVKPILRKLSRKEMMNTRARRGRS